MFDILELNKKLLPELREIGKELKIKRVESFKKQDLIYKILDTQAIQNAEKKIQPAETKSKRIQLKSIKEQVPDAPKAENHGNETTPGQKEPKVKRSYKDLIKQVIGRENAAQPQQTFIPENEEIPETEIAVSDDSDIPGRETPQPSRHEQLRAIMREFSRDKVIKKGKDAASETKQVERDNDSILSVGDMEVEAELEGRILPTRLKKVQRWQNRWK